MKCKVCRATTWLPTDSCAEHTDLETAVNVINGYIPQKCDCQPYEGNCTRCESILALLDVHSEALHVEANQV